MRAALTPLPPALPPPLPWVRLCQVYVGSFNSEAPISERVNPYAKPLFEAEQKGLLADLYEIPARCGRGMVSLFLLCVGQLRSKGDDQGWSWVAVAVAGPVRDEHEKLGGGGSQLRSGGSKEGRAGPGQAPPCREHA